MVLRAALCGLPGDAFIFQVGQDQDRNQGGGLEEGLECLDALTIGQEQVE